MDEDADNDDTIENQYKVNKKLVQNLEVEKRVKLALPIKTMDGLIVANYAKLKEVEEIEQLKKENVIEEEQNNEDDTFEPEPERAKSAIELIQEKREFLEKSKEKIAYLARSFMGNPQEEVSSFTFLLSAFLKINV